MLYLIRTLFILAEDTVAHSLWLVINNKIIFSYENLKFTFSTVYFSKINPILRFTIIRFQAITRFED